MSPVLEKLVRGAFDGVARQAHGVFQRNTGCLVVTSNSANIVYEDEQAKQATQSRYVHLTFPPPIFEEPIPEEAIDEQDVIVQWSLLKKMASGMFGIFLECNRLEDGTLDRAPFLDIAQLLHRSWGKNRSRGLNHYAMTLVYYLQMLCVAQAPKAMYEEAFALIMSEAAAMVQIASASSAIDTFILAFFKARSAGHNGNDPLAAFPLDTRLYRRALRPSIFTGNWSAFNLDAAIASLQKHGFSQPDEMAIRKEVAAGQINSHGAVLDHGHFLNPACGKAVKTQELPGNGDGPSIVQTMPLDEQDLTPEMTIRVDNVLFIRTARVNEILKKSREGVASDAYKTTMVETKFDTPSLPYGTQYSPYQRIVNHPHGPGVWAWPGFRCWAHKRSTYGSMCGGTGRLQVDPPMFTQYYEELSDYDKSRFCLEGIDEAFDFDRPNAAKVHPMWLQSHVFQMAQEDGTPPPLPTDFSDLWINEPSQSPYDLDPESSDYDEDDVQPKVT